jgi:hypothetical protein
MEATINIKSAKGEEMSAHKNSYNASQSVQSDRYAALNGERQNWLTKPLMVAFFCVGLMLCLCVAGMLTARDILGIIFYAIMSFGLLITLLVIIHAAKEDAQS